MDERLSPSARSVQGAADNPSTIHSIEAILGFKEDTVFHKATSYGMTDKPVQVKDAERNVIVAPAKKSRSTESFDGKWRLLIFCLVAPGNSVLAHDVNFEQIKSNKDPTI